MLRELADEWVRLHDFTIQLEDGEPVTPYVPRPLPKSKNTNAWRGVDGRGK